MKTKNLHHILKSVNNSTGEKYSFILIGSQAVLAHLDSDYFDGDALFVSREIDIIPNIDNYEEQQKIIDFIDANFGEYSLFDQTHGYYADGVDFTTATLAPGWKDRLVLVDVPDIKDKTFKALSFEDLLVSKLMAGREKDLKFVDELCKTSWPPLKEVSNILNALPISSKKELAIKRWDGFKERWKIDSISNSRVAKFK